MGERKVITVSTRKVWFSPSKGRHYLIRRSAIRAEAHAKIMHRYPEEKPEYDDIGRTTWRGFYFPSDAPDKYQKMLRRLMRAISKATPK